MKVRGAEQLLAAVQIGAHESREALRDRGRRFRRRFCCSARVSLWPILLKKSFWVAEQIFSEALVRSS
jgi:hypothetical protein